MKKIIRSTFVLSLLVSLLCVQPVFSQINVVSTTGYSVTIDVQPVSVIPTSSNCANGFNYNVTLRYAITFNGASVPAAMYTLQGTLGCGSGSHFFDLPNEGGRGTVTSGSNVWVGTATCNSATITSLGCNKVNIQINGPGISSRTVSYPVNVVLPVNLVGFTAQAGTNVVNLKWTTASEHNNDYFMVERSTDNNQWSVIKRVDGAVNSSMMLNYECVDNAPVSGVAYYRLKQTDLDGRVSYSETQLVNYTSRKTGVSVYPVPNNSNTITISGLGNDYRNHELQLVDAGGKILYATALSKNTVDLPSITPGMYFIRIKDKASNQATILRYVKI